MTLLGSTSILRENTLERGKGVGTSNLSFPSTNRARGLAARRLFRVPPCRKDTIHLHTYTSMPSPGFEPRPYDTAVSVTNHYTGWVAIFNFKSFSIFDVKEASRTGRLVVENIDKITEIIEDARHVSSRSIAQELKIDHKTVSSLLRKVGFKKKLHLWVPHQLTPKT
ncbi:histone-lysine N-methyltransferase SETMAR [Trichonephila clavipes]|nr:histone-lysine N-methyltransferase SETMAR [Trichonephila clavipes]